MEVASLRLPCRLPTKTFYTQKSILSTPTEQGYDKTDLWECAPIVGIATLFPERLVLVHLADLEVQFVQKCKTV